MIAQAECDSERAVDPGVDRLQRLFAEIDAFLMLFPSNCYDNPLDPRSASIARDVERCIDFGDALVSADPPRPVVYRCRNDAAHTLDRLTALRRVHALRSNLARWTNFQLETVVCVYQVGLPLDDEGPSWSTLEQEIASVTGEVIARQRSIVRSLIQLGRPVPPAFGSTPLPPIRARSCTRFS
jgi:hypothetical protein